MPDGEVTPSRLPNSNYSMPRKIEDYFLGQLGVVSGHQSFDNNILLMESFMKILPQLLFAQSQGLFNNEMNHKKSSVVINQVWIDRITQLWRRGLHCIIIRDPTEPNRILQRVVVYKMLEKEIKIRDDVLLSPWEVMSPCIKCGKKGLYGFMLDQDFSVDETYCELVCSNCRYNSSYPHLEVEVKPPIMKLAPLRPRSTNPIWIQVSAVILVKYALEGVDILTLSSPEGGYYHDLPGNPPRYKSYDEIMNSPDHTSFPSQQYYDDTIDILTEEWKYFYTHIFIMMHEMITEKFKVNLDGEKKVKYKEMERA